MVMDIAPGSDGSDPSYLVAFGGKVYFSADDRTHGHELWVTDGTTGGTSLLLDIRQGYPSGFPSFLTKFRWVSGHTTSTREWTQSGWP